MLRSSIKLAVIGGVRPHFIKIAALQSAIETFNLTTKGNLIEAIYINSGQHYDAELVQYIEEFGVKFDFTISHSCQDSVHILGGMIIQIYEILKQIEPPRWVLVIGDTNTSLAGAIAASRLNLPVVHIESGIRSNDLAVLEEIHRRLVDHISTVHFCITKSGVINLERENITKEVFWTGDLSYDFFVKYANKQPSTILELPEQGYVLATLHKSSNYKSTDVLQNVIWALEEYAKASSKKVVFVTHPKNQSILNNLGLIHSDNVHYINSLSYKNMISAIKGCKFLLTDSGGLQKEAYYLGKRCLLRKETLGWTNFIELGIHKMTGKDPKVILADLLEMENLVDLQKNFPHTDEFIRDNACDYAFKILQDLSLK